MRTTSAAALVGTLVILLAGCVQGRPRKVTTAEAPQAITEPKPLERLPAPEREALEAGPAYIIETDYLISHGTRSTSHRAPKVAVRPWQQASISMVNQQSFVQDFDVEVARGAYVADPIIGIIQDGLTLELIPASRKGAPESAWFAFHATVADLQEPIRTRRFRFHRRGQPGTIQLPAIDLAQSAGVRSIRLDERTQLTTLPSPDGKGRVDIFVRISAVGAVHEAVFAEQALPWLPDPSLAEKDAEGVLGVDLVGDAPDLRAMLARANAEESAAAGIGLRVVRIADLNPGKALTGPIPEAEARALLKGAVVKTVERLRLASMPIVGATSSALRQTAYIQDFDAIPLESGNAGSSKSKEGAPKSKSSDGKPVPVRVQAFDPVIGTIVSGYVAGVVETPEGPRLQLAIAQQAQPMPKFTTRVEGLGRVTLELPELRVTTKRFELKPGRWLVPLGNMIVNGKRGDEVWALAVWVDNTGAE